MERKVIFEFNNFEEIRRLANNNGGKKAILTQIAIQHTVDDCDSINYLLTELDYTNEKVIRSDRYSNKDVEIYGWDAVRKWVEEDIERYEEYGISWNSMGISAEAKILLPFKAYTNDGLGWNFKIQKISSGGIWGIESDSDNSYVEKEEHNQIVELMDYLRILNVDLSLLDIEII